MTERHQYRGSRNNRSSGTGWLLLIFCLAFALLLRYGQSEPLHELRQQVSDLLSKSEVYEQAVAQVGKFFSGDGEGGIAEVFGQLFLGKEQSLE